MLCKQTWQHSPLWTAPTVLQFTKELHSFTENVIIRLRHICMYCFTWWTLLILWWGNMSRKFAKPLNPCNSIHIYCTSYSHFCSAVPTKRCKWYRITQNQRNACEGAVIQLFKFPQHLIAIAICREKCVLTAGCALTCAHQAFRHPLGCLLSTLMATGVRVQASPDHRSQSRVSGTNRRNRNHINAALTKRKLTYSDKHSNQKQGHLTVSPPSSAACVSSPHCCLSVLS